MSASFLHGMYNGAAFNIATINIQLCGKAWFFLCEYSSFVTGKNFTLAFFVSILLL